jgi:predicted nucleotidyltransferase
VIAFLLKKEDSFFAVRGNSHPDKTLMAIRFAHNKTGSYLPKMSRTGASEMPLLARGG